MLLKAMWLWVKIDTSPVPSYSTYVQMRYKVDILLLCSLQAAVSWKCTVCRLSLSASVGSYERLLCICGVCKMPLFQVHSIIEYWCGDDG